MRSPLAVQDVRPKLDRLMDTLYEYRTPSSASGLGVGDVAGAPGVPEILA